MNENTLPKVPLENVFKFGNNHNRILKDFYSRTENDWVDGMEMGAAQEMYIAWKDHDNELMLLYEKRFYRYPL
jgi:hypothetical protein